MELKAEEAAALGSAERDGIFQSNLIFKAVVFFFHHILHHFEKNEQNGEEIESFEISSSRSRQRRDREQSLGSRLLRFIFEGCQTTKVSQCDPLVRPQLFCSPVELYVSLGTEESIG